MEKERTLNKKFESIASGLEQISKALESIIPHVVIKEASSFGNSAHVVLSKDLVDKKIGIIVLEEKFQGIKKR